MLSFTSTVLTLAFALGATAQEGTTWLFPDVDKFTVNNIDTVVLQWTSSGPGPFTVFLWCDGALPGPSDETEGFAVPGQNATGTLAFSAFNNVTIAEFPTPCHAQLVDDSTGVGVDGPHGVTFTSNPAAVATTFSLEAAAGELAANTTSSSSATTTGSDSVSPTSTSSAVLSSTFALSASSLSSTLSPSLTLTSSGTLSSAQSSSITSSAVKVIVGTGTTTTVIPSSATTSASSADQALQASTGSALRVGNVGIATAIAILLWGWLTDLSF